jgi:hypothetical protein
LGAQVLNASPGLHLSYQHPLAWSDEDWNQLMQASTRAGVVVCTWHDIQAGRSGADASVSLSQGLILRGQLDGTVVRRQLVSSPGTPQNQDVKGPAAGLAPGANAATQTANTTSPPWDFFSDAPQH